MRNMRLHKREIKDSETLIRIIEECSTVRLGLTDNEGMFIVPVNYGYDIEMKENEIRLALYIHGSKDGRKADAFRENHSVAVEMDCMDGIIKGDYTCSYSCAFRSIMGTGVIRELTEEQDKIHGLTRIMEHMSPGAVIEFTPEMLTRTGIYKIDITHFTGKERKKKPLS